MANNITYTGKIKNFIDFYSKKEKSKTDYLGKELIAKLDELKDRENKLVLKVGAQMVCAFLPTACITYFSEPLGAVSAVCITLPCIVLAIKNGLKADRTARYHSALIKENAQLLRDMQDPVDALNTLDFAEPSKKYIK